jgi:hypothetical protein
MATSVTQSLFGITPESIMQERSAAANRQALDFARLDPFEAARYGLFRGASQLGEGLTSAMGYEDPEIARAKARQGMLSGVDLNNPESLLAKAQSLQATDPMAAQSLVAQAQGLAQDQAVEGRAAEKAAMEKNAAMREEKYRQELAELPPDATDADVEKIARKYGKADELLKIAERRQAREIAAKEREERDLRDHRNRIEIAQMNNASKETIAAMNKQFLAQQALMRREDKAAERAAKNSGKVLPARLQTAEDDDFSAIDTASSVVADIKPIIENLNTNQLNLNKLNQLKMNTQAFFGSKDPEVLRYQELERNLTRFVNESLRLNKGVQTEGDAQRAAAEYQAAFSKNSTEGMKKALQELEKINNRQIENRKKQVDRRRKAQGVEAYFEKSDADVMSAADRILQGK